MEGGGSKGCNKRKKASQRYVVGAPEVILIGWGKDLKQHKYKKGSKSLKLIIDGRVERRKVKNHAPI